MKLVNLENSIGLVNASLEGEAKTYTLHFIPEAQIPEDGYVEVAFTEKPEHTKLWSMSTEEILSTQQYILSSFEEVIDRLSTVYGKSIINDFIMLTDKGVIPTDRIFKDTGKDSWVFVSEKRVCCVFRSVNWDNLSEYHSEYLQPTRH